MSYTAIVCRVTNVRPHSNADRLNLGTCSGNQVVLGKDTADNSLGIFFGPDGQLSHEFCLENNLYNNSARQRLGLEPVEKPGFFDYHRRVRSQRFRGEKSDGIWLPLSSLDWAGSSATLKEGDTLTEFGGYQICNKYFTPATLRAIGGQKFGRRDAKCFPKHEDTKQYRFVAQEIPDDSVIYISEKLHGTSMRLGLVMDEVPLHWLQRAINKGLESVGLPSLWPAQAYTYLNGSRNVILEKTTGEGWYGTNQFRYDVAHDITLHKGEIIYGEIVGWVDETKPIMPPHDVTKTGLKDIRQQYGDTIHYTYGCPVGEHRLYVYKIARVNEDGQAVELGWPTMVQRCRELGLAHVPLLFGPTTFDHLAYIYGGYKHDALMNAVEAFTDGPSSLNPAQIREGVVVRCESSQGITHLKHKSFEFGVLEGYLAENDSFVDPEVVA